MRTFGFFESHVCHVDDAIVVVIVVVDVVVVVASAAVVDVVALAHVVSDDVDLDVLLRHLLMHRAL